MLAEKSKLSKKRIHTISNPDGQKENEAKVQRLSNFKGIRFSVSRSGIKVRYISTVCSDCFGHGKVLFMYSMLILKNKPLILYLCICDMSPAASAIEAREGLLH